MPKLGHFTDETEKATFLRAYDAVAARWPVPSTDLDIATSFGTTRVRKSGAGAGTPLLLLPGIGGNAMFWEPFIEELARDRVVYTSDVLGWAGRGEQTAPIRDESDIAEWGTQLITGLGVERVHLAGYSAGAWLVTVIGAAGDDRLAGISLLEPSPATFARPPWKVLRKFLFAGFRPSRAKLEKLNQWLSPTIRPTEEEWALTLSALAFRPGMPWARPLPAERFAAIAAPLLVLFGAESVVHDAESVANLVRQRVPSAEIEIYPGVGHDLIWAIPERVIPRLLEFVDSHDPAALDRRSDRERR
ncbi:alpha/beta fold hydrolase [Nocardia shimofusensis]|uniref:alpha/beta fold hydrolase n=1 Tax=Nocardia shimofusensis TaxID=228596 RepID=UPI000834ECF0|nr:alpha/beta hydrolase [Nocardia shimofusensis]